MNKYIKVEGRPDLVRDPYTGAILNYNYEKLNSFKNMENLNNKYNILDKEIQQIKCNISDIKNLLLSVLNKEERSNGNR